MNEVLSDRAGRVGDRAIRPRGTPSCVYTEGVGGRCVNAVRRRCFPGQITPPSWSMQRVG
jgi:hypothetical protein